MPRSPSLALAFSVLALTVGSALRVRALVADSVVVAAKLDAEGFSQLLIPVRVADHTFWCSADTGGSWVFSLDATKARKAGLEPNAEGASAGVGPSVTRDERVRGATVDVGGVVLRNVTIVLVPRPAVVPDIDCVFGTALLADYVVQFDFVTPALRLLDAQTFQPSPNATAVSFDLDQHRIPYGSAKVRMSDGMPLDARLMFDTGSSYYGAVLLKPFIDRNSITSRIGTMVPRYSDQPGMALAAGRARALIVGPFELLGPVTALITTPAAGSFSGDGMLGLGFFRRFTATFDYGRRQVWLEPNARFTELQDFDASGVEFRPVPGRGFVVAAVAPNSPAAVAGVKDGDILRAIDGREAGGLTLGDIQAFLSRDGTTCTLQLERGGERLIAPLHLQRRL